MKCERKKRKKNNGDDDQGCVSALCQPPTHYTLIYSVHFSLESFVRICGPISNENRNL